MNLSSRSLLSAGTLIALIATAGSLYFSEVMGLYPCDLCWYQRLLMYPLVVIFGVAAYENRTEVYRTAGPLVLLGLIVSGYHSLLQQTDFIGTSECTTFSCETIQYQFMDVVTIPNLALAAFLLLSVCLLMLWRK